MYVLEEEGELGSDLSSDPNVPGTMGFGSYLVEKGKIVAVGGKGVDDEFKVELEVFEDKKWSFV